MIGLCCKLQCLESKKTPHGRNTLTLFEEYMKKRESSVNAVMKALESMERKDALEVLQNALPGKQINKQINKVFNACRTLYQENMLTLYRETNKQSRQRMQNTLPGNHAYIIQTNK